MKKHTVGWGVKTIIVLGINDEEGIAVYPLDNKQKNIKKFPRCRKRKLAREFNDKIDDLVTAKTNGKDVSTDQSNASLYLSNFFNNSFLVDEYESIDNPIEYEIDSSNEIDFDHFLI